MSPDPLAFTVQEIMAYQQNRYPMLFIDAVTECVPGRYANGYKLFSYNEWYFHGYDTDVPKVWNVVQIEAMSQMFLMTFLTKDECRGAVAMSNRFDRVEFKRKIEPGDRLDLCATLVSFRRGIARGNVEGYVGSELACSMECTIVVPDIVGMASQAMGQERQSAASFSRVSAFPASDRQFGAAKIRECLLNKYPWLLIDRVSDIEPGKFVKAFKNFTFNERYFPAHFPGDPSVPGFIQIECCMQAFLLSFLSLDGYKRRETADRLLTDVRVRRKIIPGEALEIHAQLDSFRRGVAKGTVESFVNGEPAISFGVTAVVVDELAEFLSRR